MSLILSRYECAECGKRHVDGSKAQARCEDQRRRVNETHETHPCPACRLWPAWSDGRCQSCGTSPQERGDSHRRIVPVGNLAEPARCRICKDAGDHSHHGHPFTPEGGRA